MERASEMEMEMAFVSSHKIIRISECGQSRSGAAEEREGREEREERAKARKTKAYKNGRLLCRFRAGHKNGQTTRRNFESNTCQIYVYI